MSEKNIQEDAPTNAVGSGEIAGVGVGPDGEPGVHMKKKRTKYQKQNESDTKKIKRGIISFKQFANEETSE